LHYDTTPAGLTPAELIHYRRGFDRGARTFERKNGGPGIVHADGAKPATGSAAHRAMVAELAAKGRAYREERHPTAHKAGMSSLRSYVRKSGALGRLEEITDPCAPVKGTRKPRKLAAVPAPVETAEPVAESTGDVLAAGIESGHVIIATVTDTPASVPAPMPAMTWAARKATRRELAAKLRAQGVRPSGEAWISACREAGLISDEVSV
jgi:hypothetical protein